MTSPNTYALVAARAAMQPDAVAIVDRGPVTYSELMQQVDRIAGALARRDLPAETPVAVLGRRDAGLVATLLAVWKVGACYVPLDLDDPPARQTHMIRSAGCRMVVGTGALLDALRDATGAGDAGHHGTVPEWLAIEDIPDDLSADEVVTPDGGRLAYVLFTSGSTGAPKGVEVEHRSLVNLLEAARDLLAFGPADRYLAESTLGFDISLAELFVPLITGGSMLLRDRQLLLDPAALAADLREHGVTVMQTGPTVWSTILANVPDFPRLRVAISTGEAIAPTVAERLVDVADEVWNLYGPTEATVWATGHRLERPPTSPDAGVSSPVSAPIGVALDNVTAMVVDERGTEVADGVMGELWLGGAALARGYRGNPSLTDERFVTRDGHRWYRTGDSVVRDAAGVLHYFGRNDDQVKVRGVRIEPMEVESAITSLAGVAAAAATWFENATGSRSIVAAVVPTAGATLTPRALHDALADALPGPMIPSRFVVCDTLPRSPSGKIDRVAIRSLGVEHRGESLHHAAVFTPTERELSSIWQRTLGIDAVGPDDHFFTVGGDSLAAVTMMLDVEETFAVSLPIRVVFEAPTLRSLAARIDAAVVHSDVWSSPAYIFPLVEGTGTPFFFCGVDLKLARRGMWPSDSPLYAVSQWAQGRGFLRASSVEHLARQQLDAITAIQPQGPYRLGGFSFGGLVAYELARLMRERGDEVELLFLLDATEPYRSAAGPLANDDRAGLLSRTTARLAEIRRTGAASREVRDLGKRALVNVLNLGGRVPTWQWLNYQAVHLYGRHPGTISTRLVPKDRWPAFWYTSLRLAKSYVAQPYDGRVAAVFLEEGDRSASWRTLLGPDAATLVLDTKVHHELFDQPTASRWLEFLRQMLLTADEHDS